MGDSDKDQQPEQNPPAMYYGDTPEARESHRHRSISQSEASAWAADMRHQQEHARPSSQPLTHRHATVGARHTHAPEAARVVPDWQQSDEQNYTLTLGTVQARVWLLPSGDWSALISQQHTAVVDTSFTLMQDAFDWAETRLTELQAKP